MSKENGPEELFVIFKEHVDAIAEEMGLPLISDEDARAFIAFAKQGGCSDQCLMDVETVRSAFDRGYPVFLKGKRKEIVS